MSGWEFGLAMRSSGPPTSRYSIDNPGRQENLCLGFRRLINSLGSNKYELEFERDLIYLLTYLVIPPAVSDLVVLEHGIDLKRVHKFIA